MTNDNVIYILKDPITKIGHYLGYTSDKHNRLINHMTNKYGIKEKKIWIRKLKKQGLQPILEVIEEYATPEELPAAEEFWFGYFKLIGAELYNDPNYIGKGSIVGRITSKETKKKQSAAAKGNQNAKGAIRSEETKNKMAKAKIGNAYRKGQSNTEDHQNRIVNSRRNNGNCALTLEQIDEIQQHPELSNRKMAKIYGVSPQVIQYWKNK